MKKSFLALLVASLMLVGCATNVTPAGSEGSQGGSESQGSESQGSGSQGSDSQGSGSQGSGSQGGGDVVIPTEEGKVTFYFELASSSVALPSWAGFFLTGAFSSWATAVADVVELTKLEGSDNVYYGMWATADAIRDGSYQLTVGYKADAGAPSSGVDWTFKSVECAAYEFGSNPEFEVVDGKANLGTHTWEAMPSNPADAAISNLTLSVPFTAAVPEYIDIYLVGSAPFSWSMGADETKMTPSADRKTWTMVIDTIIGNTYEIKVMANYTGETGWDHTILDDGATGNYALGVLKTWGNNYTCNLAEDAWLPNNVFDIDWATFMPELGAKHAVSLKVVFDAAITLEKVYLIGNFTDWAEQELATTDNLTYTYDAGQLAEGFEMQFGVCADTGWHRALKLGGNNNTAVVGDADLEVVLTAGEGAAAFLNAATGTETDWVNFEVGTIVDSQGTREYVADGLANLASAKANDSIEFYGKILGQYGNQNEYYVAYGQHAIDVYQVALPEGIAVGDVVKVAGKISIYKGLIEVANATYTAAPNVVVPATTPLAVDGTNFSFDALSLPCVVEGTVKEGTAIDGTANKTVKIVVGDQEIAVFVKKNIGLDYAALNTALGTTGATVKLAGFVAIFDGASTVDYATSTGYQVVAPSVVPAA